MDIEERKRYTAEIFMRAKSPYHLSIRALAARTPARHKMASFVQKAHQSGGGI
jgi:hypothetical protein